MKILLAFLLALAPVAHADEALFGYLYTTDSLPEGHWELEQIVTYRAGKARGTYRAFDFRHEVEYGITSRFSASLYLNSSWLYTNGVYDPEDVAKNSPDHNQFDINGTSMEFKYRLLSPYTDAIGLSLYLEPEVEIRDQQNGEGVSAEALEFRAILHKTYLDDTLVFAANLMLEPEWERVGDTAERELWAEFTFGGTYRVFPNWFAGFEFRNHREFPNMSLSTQEHSAFFLGPNLHFAQKDYWITLTVLPQIAGNPGVLGDDASGKPIDGGSLHLGQHEKLEARLKMGWNF